ncbi:MAG: Gfo/Idh/MocA family oxidoreductase [Peptoniphilaceae bacterium]|nr:Gfo/Idh/MocA family oxidoreductase [Peptoniphilaceae bacterium]MDY6018159.1 Gfo/Idh/MocA family oxidoreductase [Anaerococcus sp.]
MKLGIIGSGKIVKDVLSFIGKIEDIELEAIGSTERSYEKCQQLKEEYGIKKAYKTGEDLLNDPDVEVTYIAVPNFLHYDMAKKALKANKHVICEKPFTSNSRQLNELIDLARNKNLILLEAISNIYLPNVAKIKDSLKEIGNVRIVSFNYSQYSSRYDAFKVGKIAPVFDVNKDGGALVDLNIYNIHLMVDLFGQPQKSTYLANVNKGIDTSGILCLDYGDFKAIAIGAKDSTAPLNSTIQGDEGSIVFEVPNEVRYFDLNLNNKDSKRINVQNDEHRLYYEFVEFERIIREKDYKKMKEKLQHSIKVLNLVEEARLGAGIIYPSDNI